MFKVKYYPNRAIARFKAQLIAQSFSQIVDIDYKKTFEPIIKRESFCIFLAIFVTLGFIIYSINIIHAYLESLLDNNKYLIFIKLSL